MLLGNGLQNTRKTPSVYTMQPFHGKLFLKREFIPVLVPRRRPSALPFKGKCKSSIPWSCCKALSCSLRAAAPLQACVKDQCDGYKPVVLHGLLESGWHNLLRLLWEPFLVMTRQRRCRTLTALLSKLSPQDHSVFRSFLAVFTGTVAPIKQKRNAMNMNFTS